MDYTTLAVEKNGVEGLSQEQTHSLYQSVSASPCFRSPSSQARAAAPRKRFQARARGGDGNQTHSQMCRQIEDKRAARGKQYDLARLLMVLILAKLAGMKSLLRASDWVRDQDDQLRERLHLSWKQMPCANTSKYALARLESQPINEQFRDWLVCQKADSRCGNEPGRLAAQAEQRGRHVAIDGKVLKGTGKQVDGREKPQKHILHVYEMQTGIVLH